MFACLVWDFHTVVSFQCRNPVFEGSSWRLHSVNQGCGSGGAGIPHNRSTLVLFQRSRVRLPLRKEFVSFMVSRLRVPCLRGRPSSHFRS